MNAALLVLTCEHLLPESRTSRHLRFTVDIPLQAGEEEQQRSVPRENASRGGDGRCGGAICIVKALQPVGLNKMGLLHRADASKRVEVGGQPSLALGEKSNDEFPGIMRTCADQVGPILFSRIAAGNEHRSVADANAAAIEIEYGS